jgi:hypothetical protein
MRTIEKTLYKYSELSESAQEKAREWYRSASAGDEFYAECVYDDAATMADILGIDLRQTRKTKMEGSHSYEPTIYYSGFWSQGDGACFKGDYRYKPGASAAIRQAAPTDTELHRIADALQAVQKRYFYALRASCTHPGHYMHSGCMRVEVEHSQDSYRDIGDAESDITQLMRDFADWIYAQLENAYEWDNSDNVVSENIIANEYEFDDAGNIQ